MWAQRAAGSVAAELCSDGSSSLLWWAPCSSAEWESSWNKQSTCWLLYVFLVSGGVGLVYPAVYPKTGGLCQCSCLIISSLPRYWWPGWAEWWIKFSVIRPTVYQSVLYLTESDGGQGPHSPEQQGGYLPFPGFTNVSVWPCWLS